jgi:hypothetical protein
MPAVAGKCRDSQAALAAADSRRIPAFDRLPIPIEASHPAEAVVRPGDEAAFGCDGCDRPPFPPRAAVRGRS